MSILTDVINSAYHILFSLISYLKLSEKVEASGVLKSNFKLKPKRLAFHFFMTYFNSYRHFL